MKNKARLFGIYLPVFAVVTLAAVVMRSVALFSQFDFETGYFDKHILIGISDYTVVAASIFFFTYIFTARRDISLIPDFTSPATYVPTGIVSVALIFISKALFDKARQAMAEYFPSAILVILLLLSSILALVSIVHFVLTALVESHSSTKRASFGLVTVIFLSIYATYLYFSIELPLNAPNKTLDQMAFLFSAVFFLYEIRLSIGREKWRSYIALGFIAALVTAYSAIPSVIIYFAKQEVVSNSIYESALTLSVFVFITARIMLTGDFIENRESSTVASLVRAAELRDSALNPAPVIPEIVDISGESLSADNSEKDDNQLTIEDFEYNEATEIETNESRLGDSE